MVLRINLFDDFVNGFFEIFYGKGGDRTRDQFVKSKLLYQLSYLPARGQRIELCQMVLETFSPALGHCLASLNLSELTPKSSVFIHVEAIDTFA
jgi:hypothetical protein